jgi:hypothetical protein
MGRRTLATGFAAALVLLTSGCGGTEKSAVPSQQLTDLHDITQLRSLFNSRSGQPRLILLVSPT